MASSTRAASSPWIFVLILVAASAMLSCGGGGYGGGGGGGNPPSAPTGLAATAGDKQVGLTWSTSSGATSYNVKRATTSGSETTIASANSASYTDMNLTDGTKYYYVVSAVNSYGESGNSSEVNATPALAIPAAPTGLTATPGDKQVALAWTASAGAASYNVKRSTTSGSEVTIASPTGASYTDVSLTDGTKYYYEVSAVNATGESANSSEVNATPALAIPATPTGLTATPSDKLVALAWTASAGAASYNVKRSTTSGSEVTIASPTGASYTDPNLTDGTKYYYKVSAVNAAGESANSSEVNATPVASSASVHVTVDVLSNRHTISPYVYGGAFPKDKATITDSGLTTVRWGGNGASTYNWQLGTTNADNDYFFEDFTFGALNNSADSDSTQFIKDVKAAGSAPLMTMVMLPWVAQSPETSVQQGTGTNNYHWTFSVSQDAACNATGKVDKYNIDAGVNLQSDCSTTMVASSAQLNRAYFPLLDDTTQTCTVGTCVYRKDWATALATAFGSGSCPIPYSSITSCHFYDMDNEIDIWGGTHVDVHPNPTTYSELRDIYLTEAAKLKGWDPQAVRMGWVSCCWYYYWNSAASDKGTNANIDFMPWWLNEVAWRDEINGARTLDIFDLHAYPETSIPSLTATTKALVLRSTRDWWDPSYTSEAWFGTNSVTAEEPLDGRAFRIPRARAWANAIYPGTPLAFTEWNFDLGNDSDFSTALADVDAYGILGRERASLSTRWTTPDPAAPNYLALKLYTNYDASHHGFAPMSVSATNDGDPSLFSSYAALNPTGTSMTLIVVNKDPANSVTAQLNLNGFTPGSVTTYTLAASAPTTIAKASPAWSSTMTFVPYSATLLVVSGTMTSTPASEWDLNPDTIMVPAGGTVTLQPKITSGTTNVNLSSAVFDSYEGVAACSGTLSITTSAISSGTTGAIKVTAGNTPGFCHFTVTGSDSGALQTQGGWIVVGNPAATITKTGDGQTGGSLVLKATLVPGSSGGTATGASIFFTTDKGTLSQRIVTTDGSGDAGVTLTLPSGSGTATVTAEGPYGLGHPVATFTETSN
jgi:fibronectin type 3 domain-containing protein